jgi:DNA polymerase I
MQQQFQVIHQPDLLSYFKPDVPLDENIILIGTQEHNLDLFDVFIEEFRNCKIFALDTETFGSQGVEALYFYYNKIRLLQIGLESGKVLIIDFGGWQEKSEWENIKALPNIKLALDIFAEKCFANDVAIIGQNLSFDFNNIRQHLGIIARQARDLMVLSQIIWAGVGAYKHGTTALCALGHGLAAIADRLGFEIDKSEQTSAWGWPLNNTQINYAAKDVRILFPMFAAMRQMINDLGIQYTARAESRAVAVFANMQFKGVPVIIEEAQKILDTQSKIVAEQVKLFNEIYPGVQYTSAPQILKALKAKFPDKEIESTGKEILVTIACPGVRALLKAKKAEAQVKSCRTLIDYSFNGCIHALFNQISPSATGRSTSKADVSGKNNGKKYKITIGLQAQNVNKKIKDSFGFLEDDEMILGVYDGSAMHQRIATQFSQDPSLIAGYLEDKDLHSVLASQIAVILGEDPKIWTYEYLLSTLDEVDAESKPTENQTKARGYRAVAKTAFYGALNGSGAGKILMALHAAGYSHAEFEHAKKIYDEFNRLYEKLVAFIKQNHKLACAEKFRFDFNDKRFRSFGMHQRDYGRIRTLTGRIQYLEFEDGKHGKQVGYTKATGNLWQLAEGDMLKMWMADVQDIFWETPEWQANVINMIHDEILVECRREYKDVVAKVIVNKMNEIWSQWVNIIPVVSDKVLANPSVGMVNRWSEGK